MSVDKCKSVALKYVATQVKTEGQTADYLSRKGFEQDEISETIEFLREYNYVDDVRYCQSYYKEACRKNRGRRRIEQELENKKISKNIIRETLDEFLSDENPDYEEIAKECLTERERALREGRKMLRIQTDSRKEADENFMAKAGRRLISLGYGRDVIYSVIGSLMKESEHDRDEYE